MVVSGDLLESGAVLSGYRIDELIGRGGMGLVYRATHVTLDRIYALKVLAPALSEDSKFQERFKREMRIAASLHHPNVVGIHYAGEHDGILFFVMDLVTGTDLRHVLVKQGAREPARAVELLSQVASALDTAHSAGLVHRDVKPANILIERPDGEGQAYLTDFGLAKRPDTASDLTATGLVVGTVDYMAPEQITGSHVDACTDIYALGCVFFQMLTGKVPYERDNSVATLYAHVHEPPPPLDGPITDTHPAFASVIGKAMAKDPGDRYLSAGDLARDAAAVLNGERYSAAPTVVAIGEAKPLDAPTEPAAAPTELAPSPTEPAAAPTELAPSPTEPAAAPTAQTPPPTAQAAAPTAQAPPPTPPTAQAPKPRWFQPGPAVAIIAAVLGVALVAVLFATHVISTGSSSTSQTAVTSTSFQTTEITSTSTATATATATSSTTTPAPGPVPATSSSPQGAVTAVNNYWSDIASGNFAAAYTWDAPGVAGQTQSQFVASEQQANIQSIQFQGKLNSSNGNNATVGVVSLNTVDQQNGCRNWSGEYQLSYTGGNWLIKQANLQPQGC